MNSKITSFNFNNCPNLKRIYISPICEIVGQIDLSNTPIKKRVKYDEYEEGDEGVIITSDRIFKKYVRLGKKTVEKETGNDGLNNLDLEEMKKRIEKLEQEKSELTKKLEREKDWYNLWWNEVLKDED